MNPLFVHHPQLSSTNDFALQWLKSAGAGETMVVTTDDQFKGRGQRQHEWNQQPGLDLAWTLAHKRDAERTRHFDDSAPFAFNKSISLRVCEVVESILPSHVDIGIKWPNDIMLRSDATEDVWRKCAGLLIENIWRGRHWEGVALGIGMNVYASRQAEPGRIALTDVGPSIPDLRTMSKQLYADISPLLMAQEIAGADESAYQKRLIGRNAWELYTHREVTAKGKIQKVDDRGRLCMQWEPAEDILIVQDSKELTWDWLNR
jgi:biotin-(acetyl-CoA carboxylase) ligase